MWLLSLRPPRMSIGSCALSSRPFPVRSLLLHLEGGARASGDFQTIPNANSTPPRRPSPLGERVAQTLFRALAPSVARRAAASPPAALAPFERFRIARRGRSGELAATWFPPSDTSPARGGVLLLHPWVEGGQEYFYRRGRIAALRAAGYGVLTFDLPGFGASSAVAGFFDRDVEDAVRALLAQTSRLGPDLPHHVWGVSSGGYWAHLYLSRADSFHGAFFEDVSAHLLEWSARTAPMGKPFYALYRNLLATAYRFLDLRQHAPHLRVHAVAYVGGERDLGIPADETRELAALAGGHALLVEGANHLASIQLAKGHVLELALATFASAEAAAVREISGTAEPAR